MIRLTSNLTLFFKIFIPVFFVVFYGLFTGFTLFSHEGPLKSMAWLLYSNLIFYLSVLFILYKTVFQLCRVDCAKDHFIVSNYHKSYRYSYDAIETYREMSFLFFAIGTIRFKSKSSLGLKINFLIDRQNKRKIIDTFGEIL